MSLLEPTLDHLALGPVLRQRLREKLDIEFVGDNASLDNANHEGHPDRQAIYVEFAGEYPESDPTLDSNHLRHLWAAWIIQRTDYPDWEQDYGRMRACLVAALQDWQPATDVADLELIRDRCDVVDYPGLRADMTVWLLKHLQFNPR